MKSALLLVSLIQLPLLLTAADSSPVPQLGIPGKVIFESKLDTAPESPWKAAKGKWEMVEGAWKGSELVEDKHGAVIRLSEELSDFALEYECKLDGARSTSLSINAKKDHMARILLMPNSITIQRDDNDHEGPDKSVVFARFPAELEAGAWHKVRLEMVGDTMLGSVDGMAAYGSDALFKTAKMAPGFTVGGQSVSFRNLTIREATLNPEWDKIKATLPKPGEKVTPAARPNGNAKAKKKTAE